ncbi:MAG: glycosyltransferase [Tissierellia bacterium]|nr:glycosyltransferase [Tissierellia bacterium]
MLFHIYTCSFGSGHRRGAEKLGTSLDAYQVKVFDFLEELTPKWSNKIYEEYAKGMRTQGKAFNVYMWGDAHKKKVLPWLAPIKKLFFQSLDSKPLPLAYGATYSFVAYLLSEYKKERKLNTPLITYVTDFTPHEVWVNEGTDLYVVNSNYTKKKLMELGVDKDKIVLPDKKVFPDKKIHERPHLLVTGGGLGLLPEDSDFYFDLQERFQGEVRIICGSNSYLKEVLEMILPKEFQVYGFVDNMEEQLDWADICIGKAGGLTVYEALERGIPFGFFTPFLPQEERNGEFLTEEGLGFHIDEDNMYAVELPSVVKMEHMKVNMENELSTTPGELVAGVEKVVLDYVDTYANLDSWNRPISVSKHLVQKVSAFRKGIRSHT